MLRLTTAWRKRLSVRSYDPVTPERFKDARKRLRWSLDQAADYLWVTSRTIRNWESGQARIPYAAYRLLRLRSGHAVMAQGWDGWEFSTQGALISPAGRLFHVHELEQIERVFAQAQLWRKSLG